MHIKSLVKTICKDRREHRTDYLLRIPAKVSGTLLAITTTQSFSTEMVLAKVASLATEPNTITAKVSTATAGMLLQKVQFNLNMSARATADSATITFCTKRLAKIT